MSFSGFDDIFHFTLGGKMNSLEPPRFQTSVAAKFDKKIKNSNFQGSKTPKKWLMSPYTENATEIAGAWSL